MTIGKDWKREQQEKVNRKIEGDAENVRAEAQRAIDAIPAAIKAALAAGKDSIEIAFGWLAHTDFAGGDGEKCYEMMMKRPGDNPLWSSDLAGRALIIFEWCEKNDLVCFLDAKWVKIPYNEGAYSFKLCARPR